jgi:hypothetical protein
MAEVVRLPNLHALVEPILGAPYAHFTLPGTPPPNACYGLIAYLMREGLGVDIPQDPAQLTSQVVELWFRGDERDPLALVQPWDGYVLATKMAWSDHVGLVTSETHFVHVRERLGVCLEPMQRWRSRLLQVVRLRRFMS